MKFTITSVTNEGAFLSVSASLKPQSDTVAKWRREKKKFNNTEKNRKSTIDFAANFPINLKNCLAKLPYAV